MRRHETRRRGEGEWAFVSVLGMVGVLGAVAAPAAEAQTVAIIASSSTQDMDAEWLAVATAAGATASIVPLTTLDSIAFIPTTDVLIVSSGVWFLAPNQVETIRRYLDVGGDVYLQGEYQTTYTSNQAFATLVSKFGSSFTWGGTTSGDLVPMTVSGVLATSPQTVTPLTYFWYGCHGAGGPGVTPFLHHGGQDFGWVFDTPTGGRLIHTTDQDWVRATTSPALMANILHALSGVNPCAPFHGVGCPGSGGLAPRLHLTGCPAPGAQLLLAIEDGLGGAPALLLVAAQPAALPLGGGCLLNVMPPALAVGPLPLGGSGAGQGSLVLPFVVPAGVPPGQVDLQAFVADPASGLGFSASRGMEMSFP